MKSNRRSRGHSRSLSCDNSPTWRRDRCCRISSLMFIVPQIWPPRILRAPKYTISGRRRFYSARNTLFLAVAEFTTPEIHYFWPSQVLQRPKYTISGCRRFYNARNTLFLVVVDFVALEIHYFGPSQNLQCPKYTISGRRGFCSARNTLFRAAADFVAPKIHSDGPLQICNNPSLCLTALPHRITLSWPPFP